MSLSFLVGGLLEIAGAADAPAKTKAGTPMDANGEIVIATRYLQAEGVSHAHLYLYREDGKFLRQLTSDNKGQDRSPMFAPDGAVIVFTRELGENAKEFWSVEPRSGKAQKLASAPEWYTSPVESPFFTNLQPKGWPEGKRLPGWPSSVGEPPTTAKAPDGSVELVIAETKDDPEDVRGLDGPGHGGNYLLRDLKSGKETKMGDVPGFEGLWELLYDKQNVTKFFYFDGPLRLAFYGLHIESSTGDACYALDLTGPRLVRLAENWTTPFPLPGEGAFLTLTDARYLPIPNSPKTANCSYIERWDAKLQKIKYAKDGTAPVCYGASIYRPGKTPAVVTVKDYE
ncbi:MAG: TolB family protein [Chthoniobacter sp.]